MLILISPAKRSDYQSPLASTERYKTQPGNCWITRNS